MKESVLDLNNKFFGFMGTIGDLIILNCLFIICCIPIVTIGASISALYGVSMKLIKGEGYLARGFFHAFRQNFKSATIVWSLCILFIMIFMTDIKCLDIFLTGETRIYFKVIFYIFGVIGFMIFCYVFPMISKFYNTVVNYVRSSFFMSIRHIVFTVPIILMNLIPLILYYFAEGFSSYLIILYILFGFSFTAYVNSHMFNYIFSIYSNSPSKAV